MVTFYANVSNAWVFGDNNIVTSVDSVWNGFVKALCRKLLSRALRNVLQKGDVFEIRGTCIHHCAFWDDLQFVLRSLGTLMFINIISLSRWNANRCYSLRTTYLIFEAIQISFPTASLIFTAAKLFHQVIWKRTKHKASTVLYP